MQEPSSVQEIDLIPIPGKTYFSHTREWREEFIYFLLVDRFHDGAVRAPVRQSGRSQGVQGPDDFYGGKIKGITQNLDYIANLGCTAIWLSPVFENNSKAYHGYNINNYLTIVPHRGSTLQPKREQTPTGPASDEEKRAIAARDSLSAPMAACGTLVLLTS